jgi:hypothetical protein
MKNYRVLFYLLLIILISGCQEGGTVTGSSNLTENGLGSISGKLLIDKGIKGDTDEFISLGGTIVLGSNIDVKLLSTETSVRSDELGNYFFYSVPEGNHSIIAESIGYKGYIENIQVKTGAVTDTGVIKLTEPGSFLGTVRLAGESDHSQIEVSFPFLNKIFYTSVDGSFSYDNLPAGDFFIKFHKFGYKDIQYKINIESGFKKRVEDTLLYPLKAEILESDFSGELISDAMMVKEKSPYYPKGDITVPNGAKLIIEPGVEIIFPDNMDIHSSGHFSGTESKLIISQSEKLSELMIKGSIYIIGSYAEPVKIGCTSKSGSGLWGGIFFSSESSDSQCLIMNCEISGAYCAVSCDNASPELKNVKIQNTLNYGIGISGKTCNLKISNFISQNCGKGIHLVSGGASIKNSIVTSSLTSGIKIENSDFFNINNSIISNCSGGIDISDSRSVYIKNSIIGENLYGIMVQNSSSVQIHDCSIIGNTNYGISTDNLIQLKYNNVYGNQSPGNTSKIPGGGNYTDIMPGYGDIQAPPEFIDSDYIVPWDGDWNLKVNSLLIKAGTDNKDIGLTNPSFMGLQKEVFFNE